MFEEPLTGGCVTSTRPSRENAAMESESKTVARQDVCWTMDEDRTGVHTYIQTRMNAVVVSV